MSAQRHIIAALIGLAAVGGARLISHADDMARSVRPGSKFIAKQATETAKATSEEVTPPARLLEDSHAGDAVDAAEVIAEAQQDGAR